MKNNYTKLHLFRFVKQVMPVYVSVVFINIIFVSLDMISPQISRLLVDEVIIGNNYTHLNVLLLGILLIGVARAVLGYTREFSCDWGGSKIGCEIRKDFFQKLQGLSANFFDRNNPGELMARVKDDVGNIWGLFTYIGMLLCEVAVHITFVLFCMFRMNWKLSLIPALSMVVCFFIALTMEKKLGPLWGQIGEENQLLNNTAQENLNGVRTVKSFGKEDFEIQKFTERNEKFFSLNFETSKVFVRYHPVLQIFKYLIPIAVLLTGGLLTIRDKLTPGELTAFVQYSMNVVWPIEMFGWLTSGFSQAKASIKRIDKIYSEVPAITDSENAKDFAETEIKGNVKFDKVFFASENGTEILKDISFELGNGQTLGIMGDTGSGKTTIINLLTRMYDVTGGSITLDGRDIRNIPVSTLRKNIAVVMQDVFLFSESIDGNIRLGQKGVLSDEAVAKAMADSCSREFVTKLEHGQETVIGERGVGLSGGQKQRLTMARAMSRGTPVLVFDDSTSALDAETEKQIQKTLDGMKGMTKIIIAHRISSVKNADKIIVLENGKIAESGTHEQLLAEDGLYAETFRTQYGNSRN